MFGSIIWGLDEWLPYPPYLAKFSSPRNAMDPNIQYILAISLFVGVNHTFQWCVYVSMGFIHIFVGTFDVCVGANESMLIKNICGEPSRCVFQPNLKHTKHTIIIWTCRTMYIHIYMYLCILNIQCLQVWTLINLFFPKKYLGGQNRRQTIVSWLVNHPPPWRTPPKKNEEIRPY